MEYRFFYPIDESVMNTKWKATANVEHRNDIYFIIPAVSNDEFHLECGLKLRNRKTIELKIREKRYSDGHEYWLKTIRSNKTVNINDIDSIVKVLKNNNANKLIERLQSSKPIIICYVDKYRQGKYLSCNITQELTGLHLKFVQYDDHSQIGNDLFFETVCLERSDSKLVDEKILENLSREYNSIPINTMGYPEFLTRQYQKIINSLK